MRLRAATSLALVCAALLALAGTPVASAADPGKVYHTYFPATETGFDPARVSDVYSATVNEVIFERLLTYDYLARPAKLVPMTAEAMPEVADEGRTYTFHLRKGILFAADPAFKGRKRELVAQDYVYSILRFFDPKNRSPYAFMLEGISGLSELVAQAQKTGKFDYDAKVTGLEAVDPYTLRIRLKDTDFAFPFKLAHTSYGAVAREVIEAYADDTMAHPVGTGPYTLAQWLRGSKIVLEANPDYRGFVWDFASSEPAWDDPLIAAMKGKAMPQIGRVEISIIEESQSVLLAFQGKELDTINVPSDLRERALDANMKLLPELQRQGITLFQAPDLDITYTAFNIRDPVVGGFGKEKLALRRALIMAYDEESEIQVVRKGLAVANEMPIPRGVVGYDAAYRTINPYDPEFAGKLLDRFGYKVGRDGFRTLPDGSPLLLRIASETSNASRQLNEVWQRSLDRLKIRVQFDVSKFADNVKAAKACKLMMWGQAWSADYPDGDNFVQLLYGPNTGQSNNACYESKAFDAFYDQARRLPDSPERRRLYLEMSRQMEVDGAWRLGVSRLRNQLIHPWVKGYKYHPILHAAWIYMDVDARH
ncbi:MAG: ABC transporter substrate-binding protein [Pseudomonadota bacterium]|nr:ABC transporter substrate-binding protein [Pseudomonadota bacterium]